MAYEPDFGLWVESSDVSVELDSSSVVSILFPQCFHQARLVAGVCGRGAVTDLPPEILAALGTATTKEEVVVFFVISSSLVSVENCGRGAFESNNNSGIPFVCKDMTSETIRFPAETLRVVEALVRILPLALSNCFDVCVCSHPSQADNSILVRHVRARNVICGPRRGVEIDSKALSSCCGKM